MLNARMRRTLSTALVLGAVAGACTGVVRDPPDTTETIATVPAPARLKRLTPEQFEASVHDLLGDDINVPRLTPLTPAYGFETVGASQVSINAGAVEQYSNAAYAIAEAALSTPGARRDALVTCTPTGASDPACAAAFVRSFGRRAWRRPLTQAEVERWATLADQAGVALPTSPLGPGENFYLGLQFALAGLLQSPHFVFRVELGQSDGLHAGLVKFTSLEMATRLSYFLWNTTPDDELLAAGESGALESVSELTRQAARLLASPRARVVVRQFFSELFQLERLDHLDKLYPEASAEFGESAREETLRDVEDLVLERDADYRELFTSRRTFIDRKLAAIYRVPAPALDGFAPVELPADRPRRGLLGHASFLSMEAHPASPSATRRGRFIRVTLLCGTIPDPPPQVPEIKPPGPGLLTQRQRLAEHATNPVCAACHREMDPIGLGLEHFDGIGKYRPDEDGAPIDPSGVIDGAPFADSVELGEVIAGHPALAPCLARKLYRFAKGTKEQSGEEAYVSALAERFVASGYRVKALMQDIVTSQGFRYARDEGPAVTESDGGDGATPSP